MQIALKLGLGSWSAYAGGAPAQDIFDVLGSRNGFAVDFLQDRMVVNDASTPVNQYDGAASTNLTKRGADSWDIDPVKGVNLSATRDFSLAFPTTSFPYDPSAIHVFAKFTLNNADSGDQRYLFMIDNVGNDRFAVYTTSGAGFRWVTADGSSADTETSALALAADTPYQMLLGADAFGRSWVDDDGIQTNDQLHQIAAATPAFVGIGSYPDQVFRVLDGYLAEIAVICEDIPIEKRLGLTPYPDLYLAEGDSHTLNISSGLTESQFYPAIVSGANGWVSRNEGGSGESSSEMLAQAGNTFASGVPDVATIYAGSNDTDTIVLATPAPTADSFAVAEISNHAIGGWISVNGESRQITAIAADLVTLSSALSTIPVSGDIVSIDTEKNIAAWIQAAKAAGVSNISVIGSHYLNFASGGDTTSSEQPLRAACRLAQQAAATAESVPYIDTYDYMRQVILDGEVTQGDWAAWHLGATDTHLNAAGEAVLAEAVLSGL